MGDFMTNNYRYSYLENFKKLELLEKDGFYTYILLCGDGTLYTGWTVNLAKRIDAHNRGNGAKYTSARLPVSLVYYEEFDNKREAMSREWYIKKLNREDKGELIKSLRL